MKRYFQFYFVLLFSVFLLPQMAFCQTIEKNWNLISFPIGQSTHVETFLQSAPEHHYIRSIWSWNPSLNQWSVYPQRGNNPLLEQVEPGIGYWIDASQAFELQGGSLSQNQPDYQFERGWNLIGNSSIDKKSIEMSTFFEQGNYWKDACVQGNPIISVWKWKSYEWQIYSPDPTYVDYLNTRYGSQIKAMSHLEFGEGAWVQTLWNNHAPSGGHCVDRQIALGGGTSCMVMDGSLKCWGYGEKGKLGNGQSQHSVTPVISHELENVTQVEMGSRHGCAIENEGRVKCWGSGSFGQLGDGQSGQYHVQATPTTVTGVSEVTQLATGDYHTCALLKNGAIQCWGSGYHGQLGNGTETRSQLTPVEVAGITNAIQIAANRYHTCAVLKEGIIECWGQGQYGVLGDGEGVLPHKQLTPMQVQKISKAIQIDTNHKHSCAVLTTGLIKCWGNNISGKLGNNSTNNTSTPVLVQGITNAKKVVVGKNFSCALTRAGRVACWGNGGGGRLGIGDRANRNGNKTPEWIDNLNTAIDLNAGASHTCALLEDGSMKCWGSNSYGELGLGFGLRFHFSTTPVTAKID